VVSAGLLAAAELLDELAAGVLVDELLLEEQAARVAPMDSAPTMPTTERVVSFMYFNPLIGGLFSLSGRVGWMACRTARLADGATGWRGGLKRRLA
jgi:hypothetical protein